MIKIRLFQILRHPKTCFKTKLKIAAVYVLLRNINFFQRECIFLDKTISLDYIEDINIIEQFLTWPQNLIFNHYEHSTKGYHLLASICKLHVVAVSTVYVVTPYPLLELRCSLFLFPVNRLLLSLDIKVHFFLNFIIRT